MIYSTWNKIKYKEFIKYLKCLEDIQYKDFNSKLIPNIRKDTMIGIRIPILRKIAHGIYKSDYEKFLKLVTNKYYEETMIEGLIIAQIKDQESFVHHAKKFIDKIDNWAICDTFCNSLKIINENKKYYFDFFEVFLDSNREYYIRCSLVVFLNYYIEDEYIDKLFSLIDNIKFNTYYVNMAIAWLISMIYIKYPKKTLNYLINNNLNDFTHNKAIQKIIESYRVLKEDKDNLRKLKR